MNTPIFNPLWFYFIELFNRFGFAFAFVGCFIVCIALIVIFVFFMEGIQIQKGLKKIMIIGAILAIIGGLIPSKNTCYKMIVASYVTQNNIEAVKGEATDLIDYIIEKVDEITEEDTEEGD